MSGNTTFFGVQYPSSSDYVKDGATAIQTVATGFDSAVAIPTYNAQTGTTYTFALTDIGKTVTASNAAASIYTIPPQASVVWVANTTLNIRNLGAGVVTFAAGAGVTVTNTTNTLSQYQSAQLIRTGSNAWTVVPTSGIATSPGSTLIKTQTIGTTVASVNVTGAFSSTYDNYKIITSGGVGSASANIFLTLGATATGYYFSGPYINSYASATLLADAQSNTIRWTAGFVTTNAISMETELQSPNLAKRTTYATRGIGAIAASTTFNFGGFLDNATQYTDFTLTPSTGTLTGGTIYVYGYNK